MNYEKLFDTNVTTASMREWKEGGKKTIGTICCYVPEEIIHAAGALPVRLRATGCKDNSEGETWMTSLSCSYATSCLQYLIDGTYDLDGVIASDGCQMASRIYDNWQHITKYVNKNDNYYLQMIGAPRLVEDFSINFYRDELEDFKKEIEDFLGVEITDEKLKESVALYNETRRLIRELYELRKADNPVVSGTDALKITMAAGSMPKEEFNELLSAFIEDAKKREPISDHRARLMIVGSALDDPDYIKVIEDKGGLVVTDATCYGTRYLWEPVVLEGEDVLRSIAKSYLSRAVCSRQVDTHDDLHKVILDMSSEYKVDGVIFQKLQACDVCGGEGVYLNDLMKDEDMPMLTLEREELMSNAGQLAIRAEAFVEMVEKED